jgi:hypothetical protein
MNYTKGNWRNGLEKRRAVVCDRADGRIVTICSTDVSNHIEQDEAVANAKLIASAPELLAACQWAVEQFKRLADEGRYPEFMLSQNGGEGVMPLVKAIKRATELS